MTGQRICISTDCVCDLPESYIRMHQIQMIYFYLTTETGIFRDREEITSANVIEYYKSSEHKMVTDAPPAEEYASYFMNALKNHKKMIHITISSGISHSYERAMEAVSAHHLENQVFVIDSHQLSTGIGHLVIQAVTLRDEGKSCEEIAENLLEMRSRVVTTFLTSTTEYLYRNGRIPKQIYLMCHLLHIRPVLALRSGKLALKAFWIGSFQSSAKKYIRSILRKRNAVDTERIFLTHAGCKLKELEFVHNEVRKRKTFEEIIQTTASATVTGNCGAGTFGLIYVKEKGKAK